LAKSKYTYTLVDNAAIEKFIAVNGYKGKDLYDDVKLQRMGLALRADGIIYGKFETTKGSIKINGKILSVVDREIVAEQSFESHIDNEMLTKVDDLSETLAKRIKDLFYPSDNGALWRSTVLPGWGQYYKQRKIFGYVYGGLTFAGAAWTTVSLFLWIKANDNYYNYRPDHIVTPQGETPLLDPTAAAAEFSRLKTQSGNWQQIFFISLAATLTIYAWQLFDAWFFDGSYAKPIEKLARIGSGFELAEGVVLRGDREPLSVKIGFGF